MRIVYCIFHCKSSEVKSGDPSGCTSFEIILHLSS